MINRWRIERLNLNSLKLFQQEILIMLLPRSCLWSFSAAEKDVNLLMLNIILRFFYADLLLKISWSSGWLKPYSLTTSFIGPESRLLTPETDRRQANVMLHNWCTNWSTSTNWGAVLLSFIADTKVFCRHQEASQEAFKSYWLCYVRFLFIKISISIYLKG